MSGDISYNPEEMPDEIREAELLAQKVTEGKMMARKIVDNLSAGVVDMDEVKLEYLALAALDNQKLLNEQNQIIESLDEEIQILKDKIFLIESDLTKEDINACLRVIKILMRSQQ